MCDLFVVHGLDLAKVYDTQFRDSYTADTSLSFAIVDTQCLTQSQLTLKKLTEKSSKKQAQTKQKMSVRDSPRICFKYNTKGTKCTLKPCNYAHICSNCRSSHPVYQCKIKNKSDEAVIEQNDGKQSIQTIIEPLSVNPTYAKHSVYRASNPSQSQ